MRKLDIRNFAPPGYDIVKEIYHFKWGLLFASVYFCIPLFRTLKEAFIRYSLDKPVLMPDFVELIGISYFLFPILLCVMAGYIPVHYIYYRQGSKSIYMMRRLKNPLEYHFRCFAMPLICCCITLTVMFAVLVLNYGIYMLVTPKACLPPDQWQKIWSVFL